MSSILQNCKLLWKVSSKQNVSSLQGVWCNAIEGLVLYAEWVTRIFMLSSLLSYYLWLWNFDGIVLSPVTAKKSLNHYRDTHLPLLSEDHQWKKTVCLCLPFWKVLAKSFVGGFVFACNFWWNELCNTSRTGLILFKKL